MQLTALKKRDNIGLNREYMYTTNNENQLTEKEQKYFEYWIKHEEELPVKIVLLVGRSASILFFLFILGAFWYSDKPITASDISFGLGFPIVMCLIFEWFDRLFKKRRTKLYTSEVYVQRTNILACDVSYLRNSKGISMHVYYYHCDGIHGQVAPVSKKLYHLAKRGDDITVVWIKARNMYLGITFNDKFERDYL